MTKLTLACVDWRPLRRNTLCGFATIRIADMRLTISDVALHDKAGARWATLPAKPVLDRAGVAKREPATNKIRYVAVLEFDSPGVRNAFSQAVVAAVLKLAPDAFEDQAVPA